MKRVHVVLPPGVDDPRRPSGGNVYDRRICRGLAVRGWDVQERAVPGRWPVPDRAARQRLMDVLTEVPSGEVVLLDGLVASTVPEVLEVAAQRLRLVILVHMPLGHEPANDQAYLREGRALHATSAVVTTSCWTRRWLLAAYRLAAQRVYVAQPGVDRADPVAADPSGRRLLCVAAVCRPKGHDTLVDALSEIADLDWALVCVGSLDVDSGFVRSLRTTVRQRGLTHRVTLTGPLAGEALHSAYARADLLVLASRSETYGMVVVEALARGIPVLATDVGGVSESLAGAGITVPSGDAHVLASALRSWLVDPLGRGRARAAALRRRTGLQPWASTTAVVEKALLGSAS